MRRLVPACDMPGSDARPLDGGDALCDIARRLRSLRARGRLGRSGPGACFIRPAATPRSPCLPRSSWRCVLASAGPRAAGDDAIETQKRDLADVEATCAGSGAGLGNAPRSTGGPPGGARAARAQHRRSSPGRPPAGGDGQRAGARSARSARADWRWSRDALDRERDALGSLLRSAYATGRGDRIRMLLDQEDPNRLSRVMSYYGYLNRFRVKRIEAVAARAPSSQGLTREAEEEKTRLSMLARKQDETRERLAAAQDERAALLTALEQTIATAEESVAGLRTEAREMRLLLEQLERQARGAARGGPQPGVPETPARRSGLAVDRRACSRVTALPRATAPSVGTASSWRAGGCRGAGGSPRPGWHTRTGCAASDFCSSSSTTTAT